MTVAFDAYTKSAVPVTGNFTFNHTPVGTPRAVLVFTCQGASSNDVTGMSYGSLALTAVSGSPNTLTTGELGNITCWFGGSGIPTGVQTITAASGASSKVAYCITLTGAADTEVVDSDGTINSTSQANPSVTLSLSGRASFCAIGFEGGPDAPTGVTPFANWTARDETDPGLAILALYTYDTIGTADVSAGWTQVADDAVAIAVAVSEVIAGSPYYAYNQMMAA